MPKPHQGRGQGRRVASASPIQTFLRFGQAECTRRGRVAAWWKKKPPRTLHICRRQCRRGVRSQKWDASQRSHPLQDAEFRDVSQTRSIAEERVASNTHAEQFYKMRPRGKHVRQHSLHDKQNPPSGDPWNRADMWPLQSLEEEPPPEALAPATYPTLRT